MRDDAEVFCAGQGDACAFKLLNDCWRMIDGVNGGPGLKSLGDPDIKAFKEGGKWKGIWSQNYMGMYCWTPFLDGELLAYHDNAYNYFFDLQGDGRRADNAGMIAPVGALPEHVSFGDGKILRPHYKNDEHTGKAADYEFWVEGTCGTVVGKTDILLRKRMNDEIDAFLPKIELALDWVESLRDGATGLVRVGPAGTFIERAYRGTDMGDGRFSYGFPSGVMIHYIKALRNLVELHKLRSDDKKVERYERRLQTSLDSVVKLVEKNSYFINYLDAHGGRHGVVGAVKHGYFESNPNHDAVAYRVVDDHLAARIYATIVSIPELRQGKTICCVYPGRDDVLPGYQSDPAYGPGAGYHWNGSSWFSSEARMVMGYYCLNKFKDVQNSLGRMFELYAKGYRRDVMDNFGTAFAGAYNPEVAGAAYIDGFAVYGAGLRGLFEYNYTAESLMLHPHVPDEISEYRQQIPAWFGTKKIYPAFINKGNAVITGVTINNKETPCFSGNAVELKYEQLPHEAKVEIVR